jgi:hypothetical protein
MDNPMAGWQALVNCLRPGGLMKIGLYSELARQSIVKIRSEIESLNLTEDDIRSFRNELLNSDKEYLKIIHSSPDFYSYSDIRDLLFHVQEHRFTIPQIISSLDKLGLIFCGFENDNLIKNFKSQFPNPESLYNLDDWNAFEENNPKAFVGMYQFWCQKK